MNSLTGYILLAMVYVVFAIMMMNQFRRQELKDNPPWLGKSGIERDIVVLGEVLLTPFALIFRAVKASFGNRQSKNSEES